MLDLQPALGTLGWRGTGAPPGSTRGAHAILQFPGMREAENLLLA